MAIGDYVKNRKNLFWSTKNYDNLSNGAIVETILNYRDMNDFQELISILGLHDVAKIFYDQVNRPRINYRPEVKNYFELYFQKYA